MQCHSLLYIVLEQVLHVPFKFPHGLAAKAVRPAHILGTKVAFSFVSSLVS